MAFHPESIPQQLKDLSQWGCYKLEVVDGKKTKVPYNPTTGKRASSTDPLTWVSFGTAQAAYADLDLFDGICVFLTAASGLVFIDLDDSIKDGHIEPWAMDIVTKFDAYTEISQSGKGLHLLIDGTKPGARCRRAAYPHKVEIYDRARQCCLTGDALEGHGTIEHRQDALNELYVGIFGEEQPQHAATSSPGKSCLADEAVLLRAKSAKNGAAFDALWHGSLLGYNGNESAADQALMNHLAFYCGGDRGQMERLFSISALGQRGKWKIRRDYRERTISKALEGRTEFYKPRAEGPNADEISEEELNAYSLSEGPKFECNLPADHFIQRFMAYGSDISDAYLEYWFAGGLFALAVAADKKIKVDLKQGTIYPNLYISINGKSSLARKSTVVDKVEAMLCQVMPPLLSALVPTEFSPEAFTEHMSDHNHAPWIRDEAAGVLSLMKRDYMRGFKDSLMQLFDCKPFYRKLRTSQRKNTKNEFRVDDPYLNLLWATTDASLGANTEQNDTVSGFMARFMFFFPQGKKSKWLPLEEGTAANSIFEGAVRDQLTGIAAKIAELPECTAMHFSQEAAAYYTEWQRTREEEWTASNDGSAMQIYSRLAPSVVKLSLLFELGSQDFDVSRPIRQEFMEEACRLVDSYFMPTARAVYELVGANAEKNRLDRIAVYLKKHNGKAQKRDILRATRLTKPEFNEAIEAMLESGEIEEKHEPTGKKGRPKIWILLNENSVNSVITVNKVINVNKVNRDRSKDKPAKNPCDTWDSSDNIDINDKNDKNLDDSQGGVDEGVSESPAPSSLRPRKEDPGFQKFKAGMRKRTCLMCGEHFSYDLGIHYNGGYICARCHREGPPSEPIKADPQIKLSEVASAN